MRRGLTSRIVHFMFAAALLGAAVASSISQVEAALPAGEHLVPAATRFFVTCRSVSETEAAGAGTLLGKMIDDKVLEPFIKDLEAQIEKKISTSEVQLGIKLEDLDDLVDGQITLAVVPLAPTAEGVARTGTIVLMDVTGHEPKAAQLQQKIAGELKKLQGTTATPYQTPTGASGTHYVVPPQKEGRHEATLIDAFQKQGADAVWMLADHPDVVTIVSAMLAGQPGAKLADDAAFAKTMQNSAAAPGEPNPHFALFLEPLGFAAALRAYENPPQKHKPDAITVFQHAGFDALKGVGGQATVGVGDYGFVARIVGLAPQPWQKSMNMLNFIPANDFTPQPWVSADVAAYASLYWDVLKAFDHFGPLFDGFLEDEGIWPDVLESMKTDPDGPQIDLRKDFFELLGKRVTGLVESRKPEDADSARYLVAFEIANAGTLKKVSDTMKKAFANDPSVEQMKLGDLDVYKIIATEEVPPNAPNQAGVVNGKRTLVSALVTAANGHVFFASHADMLTKVLGPAPSQTLATAPDYMAVTAELAKFLPPQNADLVALGFVRLDDLISVDYELFRTGKMPGSQTILGRILDLTLSKRDEATSAPRTMELDGTKLPPFPEFRKYLSPLGLLIRNTPDGWTLVALTHEKSPQLARPVANAVPPAAK